MKKALAGGALVALILSVGWFIATTFTPLAAKAQKVYTATQASAILVQYLDAQLAPKGAGIARTRCANVSKNDAGKYVIDPTSSQYGCIVDIRKTSAPTTPFECAGVSFTLKPGATTPTDVSGAAAPLSACA